jgi:hypothetical protein
MVYIPYGIICIAITILIMNGVRKSRENKKTNRRIRNSERFQNIISVIQDAKEKDKSNPNK